MNRADYVIEFQRPLGSYTAIPNAMLEDRRLSAEARCALAWMSTKPNGWRLRASEAQAVLGVGRDKWQRIVRELRGVGCLERKSDRNRKGQVVAWRHILSWAPWEALPNLENQKPEKAVSGRRLKPENPVFHKPENPAPYKTLSNNKHARESTSGLDLLKFWAEKINHDTHVPSTALTIGQIEQMRALGLVSEKKLRERGLT